MIRRKRILMDSRDKRRQCAEGKSPGKRSNHDVGQVLKKKRPEERKKALKKYLGYHDIVPE